MRLERLIGCKNFDSLLEFREKYLTFIQLISASILLLYSFSLIEIDDAVL